MRWERDKSLLDSVEWSFRALEGSRHALTIDGSELGEGLPVRSIGLRELRERMLNSAPSGRLRELLWAEVAFRAQVGDQDWAVGAVWLMTPGLRKAIRRILLGGRAPYVDIEADVVEGFLTELMTVDVEAAGVPGRLWWAAYRCGLRTRPTYRPGGGVVPYEDWMAALVRPRPEGHPDEVLARAVRSGVLSADEADLIGRTRLGEEGLTEAARKAQTSYLSCRAGRARAEERLAAYLLVPGVASTPHDPWDGADTSAAA
ncbi:hypothetical protein [Streptomyces sp. HUAS TT7]|uniref:hypothetical protein n=1 Tax=Streptomyces sp. HUAS TT7 TaxID=3447507 RepID=UPI003F65C6DC